MPDKIASSLQKAQGTTEFKTALADPANAEFAKSMAASQQPGGTSAAGGVLKDSSFLTDLDPRLAKPFLQGFSQAMDTVFDKAPDGSELPRSQV